MNEVANFIDAINSAGLGTPDIQADGDIHRFHVEGDRAGSYNGWYSLHLDGVAAGAFGSWKIGFTETWRAESDKPITREERQRMRDEFGRAKRERHAERMMLQEEAADRALSLWSQAAEPMWHPYLKRKRVLPLGVRQKNKALVIPLFDVDGRLWSCQTIDEAGQKLFLKGGRVAVNFYLIGGPIEDEVFICEGFATGASLHMHHPDARHKPVAVAFNATNLERVAIVISIRYPGARITIAADNDTKTEGNPGLTAGRAAAAAVGGRLIYPDFDDELFDGTDWNDYINGGGAM